MHSDVRVYACVCACLLTLSIVKAAVKQCESSPSNLDICITPSLNEKSRNYGLDISDVR